MTEEAVQQNLEEPTTVADPDVHWYIIHTYSGQEDRVKKNLEQRIATMDMKNQIYRVVVPTEEQVEIREGRRVPRQVKLYAGYILVQMKVSDASWYVVRNTPGVTGFISAEDDREKRPKPIPLEEDEVQKILRQMTSATPRVKIGFTKGETVRITEGPFVDFIGAVSDIYADKGKVQVLVSFFGRETPVELDFLQVERA